MPAQDIAAPPDGDASLKKLHRYILGEISGYFLLCLLLLTFLLLLNSTVQLTDLIVTRGVPMATAGLLLLTILPVLLLVTLPMSTLVACILGFSRLSNDSEFTAMTASGMSLYSQLIPVAALGLFSAFLSTALMMFSLPWSHQSAANLRYEILQNQASSFEIREQVFNDSFQGLMIYVRKTSRQSKVLRGILISDSRDPRHTQVIFAEEGSIVRDPANKRMALRLLRGTNHRVEAVSGGQGEKKAAAGDPRVSLEDNRYQVVRFASYDLNLNLTHALGDSKTLRVRLRGLPIGALREKIAAAKPGSVRHNAFLVELHKRFATPFICLALALLGAPLGVQNRRSGRHGGFALSLIVVFAYYLLSSLSEGMGENGSIPAAVSVWGPIALLFAAAAGAVRQVIRKGAVDIAGFLAAAAARLPLPGWLHPKSA